MWCRIALTTSASGENLYHFFDFSFSLLFLLHPLSRDSGAARGTFLCPHHTAFVAAPPILAVCHVSGWARPYALCLAQDETGSGGRAVKRVVSFVMHSLTILQEWMDGWMDGLAARYSHSQEPSRHVDILRGEAHNAA